MHYRIRVNEYLLRDYLLTVNGKELSFRPRTTSRLIPGLAEKVSAALHESFRVLQSEREIEVNGTDRRVSCRIASRDPKLTIISGGEQDGSETGTAALPVAGVEIPQPAGPLHLVSGEDLQRLESRVNHLLRQGWRLHGPLCFRPGTDLAVQAMVRE